MLPSILMTAALAAGVMAVPMEKRDLVTEYSTRIHYAVHTVTQTVTAVASPDAGQQKDVDTNDNSGSTNNDGPANVNENSNGGDQPTVVQNDFERKQQKPPKKTSAAPSPTKAAQPKKSDAPSDGGSGGGTQSNAGADPVFIKRVVDSHNVHRANHSVPPVSWDDDLYASAMEIAKSCTYAHDLKPGGGGYGQNIAAGVEQDNITAVISDMFYNGEYAQYAAASRDFTVDPAMGSFEEWGHLTQIVWRDTTTVACYVEDCTHVKGQLKNTGAGVPPYFTVCNYKSPGNFAGGYKENVPKPKDEATADWSRSM